MFNSYRATFYKMKLLVWCCIYCQLTYPIFYSKNYKQLPKLNIRKLFIKTLVSTTLNFFKDFNSNVIRRFQQHKTSGYPISRLIENLFKFILNFYFALMFIFKLPALAYTPHTQYISKSFLFSQKFKVFLCRNVQFPILN